MNLQEQISRIQEMIGSYGDNKYIKQLKKIGLYNLIKITGLPYEDLLKKMEGYTPSSQDKIDFIRGYIDDSGEGIPLASYGYDRITVDIPNQRILNIEYISYQYVWGELVGDDGETIDDDYAFFYGDFDEEVIDKLFFVVLDVEKKYK
jgi:hypothetical protein